MKYLAGICLSLVCALATPEAGAIGIASESFVYTAGSDLMDGAHNGGTGWASAWSFPSTSGTSGQALVASSSLNYSNGGGALSTSGNRLMLNTAAQNFDQLGRIISNPLSPVNGGELWIGFAARYDGPAGFLPSGFTLGFADGDFQDSATRGFQVQYSTTTTTYRLIRVGSTGPAAVSTGNTPVNGQTDLLVLHVLYGTNIETVTLFVNPSLAASPTTGGTPFSPTYANSVARVKIIGNQNTNNEFWSLDELRIGTTFADVVPVPESSPATLMSSCGMASLWYVHRRRRFNNKSARL